MQPNHFFGSVISGGAQKVTFSNVQGNSLALTLHNNSVVICSDANCFYEVGVSSGAIATVHTDGTSHYLPSGIPRILDVPKGCVISAINVSGSSSANLYITQM
jgi:hypothetical protein